MAIRTIQLPDGRELEISEWLHWPTYSVMEFAAGAKVNLTCFNYVQGGIVAQQGLAQRTASESDTNQTVRRQMNFDESILVYDLTYEAFALSSATIVQSEVTTLSTAPAPILLSTNLKRMQRDMMVELFVGADQSKPQYRSPFSYVGQSIGAVAFSPGTAPIAGAAVSYGTGGYTTPENARRLELPIYIQPKMTFFLKVFSVVAMTDMTQNVSIRWYLDGLKNRPVG